MLTFHVLAVFYLMDIKMNGYFKKMTLFTRSKFKLKINNDQHIILEIGC